MGSIIKVNEYKDFGNNAIITSDGAGTVTSTATGMGKILQVVETTVSGQVSFNSTSYADYTDATLNITPVTTSSKIQLDVKFSYYLDGGDGFSIKVIRTVSGADTTVISYSSLISTYYNISGNEFYAFFNDTGTDSPSTTSQCTYKLQVASQASNTIYLQPQGGNLILRATEIAG